MKDSQTVSQENYATNVTKILSLFPLTINPVPINSLTKFMKVYHGSPIGNISVFERRQANIREEYPEQETKKAIYLTTEIGFALVAGGRPRGNGGGVNIKNGNELIFNDPSKFEPNKKVYIYEWELDELPEGSYEIFGHQIVVDLDELKANEPTIHLAKEMFEYYEPMNWPPPPTEHSNEMKFR